MNKRSKVLLKYFQKLGVPVKQYPRIDITSAMEKLRQQYPEETERLWRYLNRKKEPKR